MEFAIWAYPWDIRDEGPTPVANRLTEMGVSEINLATNYHSVQTLAPHNPQRSTFFARASSYFEPGDQYGRLKPVPYPRMESDWTNELTDVLDERIKLTSWTVGCHNSRLGMTHRDMTIETAFGDKLVFGLCPSNPEVQRYLVGLVTDLAERDAFDRIELETFDYFYGTGFGWHHQKIHTELGTLGEFLLGVCFCDDCREAAAEQGISVGDARRAIAETFTSILDGDTPPSIPPERWMNAHPEVAAYIDVRESTLGQLFASLADAAGETKLGYYVGTPQPGGEWMVGADLDLLADHVDYYCLPAYESSKGAVLDAYQAVQEVTPDIPLHAGILPGHPAVDSEGTVVDIVDGLRSVGAPRISFYNYGLLPDRSLRWIDAAIP